MIARRPRPSALQPTTRWIWHEIGHVLLIASVGELQFRFVTAPATRSRQSPRTRSRNWPRTPIGAAQPSVVFIPRRHDRCVSHGWSWGVDALCDVAGAGFTGTRRKAYWTEQILSSSLFPALPASGATRCWWVRSNEPGCICAQIGVALFHLPYHEGSDPGYQRRRAGQQARTAHLGAMDADIGTETWDVAFHSG